MHFTTMAEHPAPDKSHARFEPFGELHRSDDQPPKIARLRICPVRGSSEPMLTWRCLYASSRSSSAALE